MADTAEDAVQDATPDDLTRALCASPAGSDIIVKKAERKEWEPEVCELVSSHQWLSHYGLLNNNLELDRVLRSLGFRLRDKYDPTLKHPVSSRYGTGLFTQVSNHNGYIYNITSSKSKLKQVEKRLLAAIFLYRRRLDWLTSESRRTFGVIEEKSVTIVMDVKNLSPQQFHQCQCVLEKVLEEQISNINRFNIIRVAEDMSMYKPACISVSHDTLRDAIAWLWQLDRTVAVSQSATCEAVLKALADLSMEAVYLFTEGCSVDGSLEILREKLASAERRIPVHVVSYNCVNEATIHALKDLAKVTNSRFHAYAVTMELDSYECDTDSVSSTSTLRLTKKYIGGVPSGAGVREDALLIFNEMEEARNVLAQIQSLLQDLPEPTPRQATSGPSAVGAAVHGTAPIVPDEQYMGSRTWLEKYGLRAAKLDLSDNLCAVAFTHKDGVVDLGSSDIHGTRRSKLVNARYCEKFPVIRWKDGRVMHVQVTPEIHRKYEERMMASLSRIQQRISWLRQGSRELFGTVLENRIYILIDTSSSMLPHIQFVKEKLYVLMQEQLRHKMMFNLVSYNSRVLAWRDRMVDVTEHNLQMSWTWVQNLSCQGSTNTYAALQMALQDQDTEAIYLLTDGRPDQPPKSIVAQVQMQKNIPIHTISFNCNDVEANEFLCDLASATGGRYHYYNDNSAELELPDAWESEDIKLLKDEYMQGMGNLEKMTQLRDECTSMCWKPDFDETSHCSRNHILSGDDQVSAVPPLPPKDLYRPQERPKSAPPRRAPDPVVSTQYPTHCHQSPRLRTPQSQRLTRPLTAGHTRTSLLRQLSSRGSFSSDAWLLPETQDLFDKQQKRHELIILKDQQKSRSKSKKCRKYNKLNGLNSRQWLEKHGLVAKRLTILDALAPTVVSQRAKYVPILNKHVISKVFNEVLPLAHVSNRSRRSIKLVNPNGVNLVEYEGRLKQAIEVYKRRLNTIVWKALTEEKKLSFGSTDPVSFEDNRDELMKSLELSDSPLLEADIILLEKEIKRGEKFLQLSHDLRNAANNRNSTDILSKEKSKKVSPDNSLEIFENDSNILSNMTDGSLTVSTA